VTSERLITMNLDIDTAAARGLNEYVRLIADALGLVGQSWLVQLEPPANVYLALDERLPRFPERDVALVWDEEHGWALGTETNPSEKLHILGYLGDDVLPAPESVARAVRRAFQDSLPRDDAPAFRAVEDSDDLVARLTEYAAPLDPRLRVAVFHVNPAPSEPSPAC
jgi:uncharacterized protein DUF6292